MRKGTVALVVVFVALLVASARAVQEDLLDKARTLVAEAKPFVEKANDVDAEMEQRKAPRKEAFKRLKEARELYDKYLDIPANSSMEDKIDKEYVEMMVLLHGIKKDSGLGELEKETDAPELPAAGGAAPANPPSGGTAPTKPPGGDPSQPPTSKPPADPGKSAPTADAGEAAKRQLAAIRDYEKAHPGDLPLIEKFYEKFLADFPDPTSPDYAAAAEHLGKIKDRIKSVFQAVAKRDYDSLSGADSKDERSIFGRLSQDFNSKDRDERRRAASLMAASRARAATYFLARGLTDPDSDLAKICRDGLIAIGGTHVGDNLVKLYRDAARPKQDAAMDVLTEITKKGPVDAAAESEWIGHFVLSNESDIAVLSLDLLTKMGKAGGPGLLFGLDSKILLKKTETMKALAEAKYYRAATTLADRYLDTRSPISLRQPATDALKKMGVYAVPYLIPVLRSSSGAWTAYVISEITGEKFGFNDEKKVREWWNAHKPADAE